MRNESINPLVSPSKRFEWQPKFAEVLPIKVHSNIHALATSYWLVVDHPYAALTAADGTFRIDDLPEGDHTLTVWHETVGYVTKNLKVNVKAGNVTTVPLQALASDRLR